MSKNSSGQQRDDPLGRILSYLVALATIVGIPAGLYGYFAAEHARKVEKTFEFYKDFRGETFQKDLKLLIQRWNSKADEVNKLIAQGHEEGMRELTTSLVTDEEGRKAFAGVLSFFDALSACVEASLCDRNAAVALLKVPATQITSAFGSHIIYIRETNGNGNYGTGLFKMRALEPGISIF
jgi:hypothetical protein